jgi:hypothetical protein
LQGEKQPQGRKQKQSDSERHIRLDAWTEKWLYARAFERRVDPHKKELIDDDGMWPSFFG